MSARELIKEINKTQEIIAEFQLEFSDRMKAAADIVYYNKRLEEVQTAISSCLEKIRTQLKSYC